ncbi:SDR family NAD(P)-dependent oxidoreductase [Microbacterium invictum]|uniref:2-hydroxycyclohexanecarboxyl-CoA dehydrogenase n=1 Tax=Microbacterium invictum TaxID=515415 RepID=A0AA40SRY6_9MICO|nr:MULTISPECIES: SDR family NAD(P)-dependent oxidoreductase [Microbacterium]MBB4141293.1 2-hydroxycyclohexanecarboxyl-CoA dehydrogenase [Microbacterium invictum]
MSQDSSPAPLGGRVAWVTGGSSGIGAAAAQLLAAQGATVGVLDLTEPDSSLAWACCDLADPQSVTGAAEELTRKIGPADILVTSAGINASQEVVDHPDDLWERVLAINLSGTFYAIRACLPGMIERGWGRIVTVSATGGVRVLPGRAAYGSSKAAVIALTKAVAHEGAPHGVTANSVAPGLTDTPMAADMYDNDAGTAVKVLNVSNPMKVLLEPIDIAHGVAYFCSTEARYVTGQLLHVNGGAVM